MLFDPSRHEPLRAGVWDAEAARVAIGEIVRDAEARFDDEQYWPPHPLDHDQSDPVGVPYTPLYLGACGVIWALRYLGGARRQRYDLGRLLERNRAWLDAVLPGQRASYLMGDTPIRMLAGDDDALEELIRGNQHHPSRELMWGAPGTLLAALFRYEQTHDARWAELFRATAATLWSQLERSPDGRCSYWTQDLYGQRATYLGAGHGFVGTALPIIRGRQLFDAATWDAWATCIVETVTHTVERDGAQANWRPQYAPTASEQKRLVQWCHGAPGVVIALADFPGTALDELLVAGGETIWAAGPVSKGSGLCHGTAGNGYALLKLYARTGDAKWLDRARAFAMHAIAQVHAQTAQYGHGRYSLWTGDLGVAVYLHDCIRAAAAFPTLDVFAV